MEPSPGRYSCIASCCRRIRDALWPCFNGSAFGRISPVFLPRIQLALLLGCSVPAWAQAPAPPLPPVPTPNQPAVPPPNHDQRASPPGYDFCRDQRGGDGDHNQCGGGHERCGTDSKAGHECANPRTAGSANKRSNCGDEHCHSSCDECDRAGAEACDAVITRVANPVRVRGKR